MKNSEIIGAGQESSRPAPKKYKTIVADPPWQVKAGRNLGGYVVKNGKQIFDQTHQKSRELAYPLMSVEEICALPVRDIAEENAHLYIWTINRYVEQSYQVARAWGFIPSTLLVWAKTPFGGGLGGSYGISTEFILFCRRGTLPALSKVKGTWWNWKRPYVNGYPCHSKKPEQFQDIVETVSPGPYLEMFARRVRTGWTAWGDEIEESPVLGEESPAHNTKEIFHTSPNTARQVRKASTQICPKCSTVDVVYSFKRNRFYCQECGNEWSGKLLPC